MKLTILSQILLYIYITKTGYCIAISCYDTDAGTCEAEFLCYEISTHNGNGNDTNQENCIYLRGCIEQVINFADQASIDNLVKGQKGLFQVCDKDNCNKQSPPCKPKNYMLMFEECNKKVTNLNDTIKKKQKAIADLLNKINSMNDTINSTNNTINSMKDDANTNAAGSTGSTAAIILGGLFLIQLVFIIYLLYYIKFRHQDVKAKMDANDGDTEVGNLVETTSVTTDEGTLNSKRSAVIKGHNTSSSTGMGTK